MTRFEDGEPFTAEEMEALDNGRASTELAKLQALCDAATPGPWGAFPIDERRSWNVRAAKEGAIVHTVYERDARFIAAARDALPRLIADSRGLTELIRRIRAWAADTDESIIDDLENIIFEAADR